MPFTPTIRDFVGTDPADFARGLPSLLIIKRITFASVTQTLGTIPANSIIKSRQVVRLTKWNSAPTTFEIGKSGDTDWLMTTAQANVSGNIPAGEDAGVEEVAGNKAVSAATPIVLTLNQGSAIAGIAYVVIEFQELVR